ncbi:MAG: stage II sporulation protein P [Lachnospiraceae bacterium]|nr:stage II sporulation protein P [Lachnospiraceae bacterium]
MGKRLAAAGTLLLWLCLQSGGQEGKALFPMRGEMADALGDAVEQEIVPIVTGSIYDSPMEWLLTSQIETVFPLYGWMARSTASEGYVDRAERVLTFSEFADGVMREDPEEMQGDENVQPASGTVQTDAVAWTFVPHETVAEVDPADYAAYDDLVQAFYTIDANTMAGSDLLQATALASVDLTIDKQGEEPQILIYHTHSQEAYADSAEGDPATSVVGVGEHLADILRNRYGYQVLHCTETFDVESRDQAYAKALPALQAILEENPSIQVVIDLHRDQVPAHTRLVTELDGRPTARFMFFNGLSRTRGTGEISYLKNEHLAENLAFSFQMQLKCAAYYPGITRKIYLKGYRYNMHLRARSLLVELGAQNNTVEEAMNACDPLAHALDLVLSGR